ncbi:hypothetical protein SAMN05216596_101977 [Pseudomonas congelans]|uniref:Uncharacterized protein n=1 Tax=Pseudomonas congelans TaxID=200452 RepID=A0A1H0L3C5_9PSED|nr:hypothetical protein [Pseudomonas congelans]QVX13227.1 hypothetical protein DB356_14225 [Pseudomonas congelans]SDO62729.1 hypothetical protein SAMN05216596_101977 [Pseudomonas congelans]
MKRREYFLEANRLSNIFGEKMDAAKAFLENDPELEAPSALEKYWELESAASAAAGKWTNFCAEQRPLIRG